MTVMAPERAAYSRMVYEHILKNPELHDQRSFGRHTACGTTHCIAGWTVELDADADVEWRFDGGGDVFDWEIRVNGLPARLLNVAEELLGLGHGDATRLFFNIMDEDEALDVFRRWIEEAEAAA